jgi:hypothetical protein
LNGNGQRWYNEFAGQEILDPDNTYYRPILFVAENATRLSVEGITELNSPCWTNFFVNSKDISFDDVYINAFSTNASVSRYSRADFFLHQLSPDHKLTKFPIQYRPNPRTLMVSTH